MDVILDTHDDSQRSTELSATLDQRIDVSGVKLTGILERKERRRIRLRERLGHGS